MESGYSIRVKQIMEDVYYVADDLDAKGISSFIPFVDTSMELIRRTAEKVCDRMGLR